jgi:hypothetical protein
MPPSRALQKLNCIILTVIRQVSLALRSRERAKMAAFQTVTTATSACEADHRSQAAAPSASTAIDCDRVAAAHHSAAMSAAAAAKTRRRLERKRRTNRMLIAMVSIFIICWLPLNVVHVTFETLENPDRPEVNYRMDDDDAGDQLSNPVGSPSDVDYNVTGQQQPQSGTYLVVFFAVHLIAMSSAVYNPFLYAWMNENFKGHFARVVPCLFRVSCFCCRGGKATRGGGTAAAVCCCCCPSGARSTPASRQRIAGDGCCGATTCDDGATVDASTGWSPSKYTTVRVDNGGAIALSTTAVSGGHVNHVHDEDDEDEDEEAHLNEERLKLAQPRKDCEASNDASGTAATVVAQSASSSLDGKSKSNDETRSGGNARTVDVDVDAATATTAAASPHREDNERTGAELNDKAGDDGQPQTASAGTDNGPMSSSSSSNPATSGNEPSVVLA